MPGRIYGYARISASDQHLDRQRQALDGVDVLVEETASARTTLGREKLRTLIDFTQPGDTIRVKSIDRLARNTVDLLAIIDEVAAKGVAVEFIDTPQLNVTTKEGRAMLTIFAAFAQLERESIRERQREGIAAARAAGKYAKQVKLSPEHIDQARTMLAQGIPKAHIARTLHVSRQTLYQALDSRGPYAPTTAP